MYALEILLIRKCLNCALAAFFADKSAIIVDELLLLVHTKMRRCLRC